LAIDAMSLARVSARIGRLSGRGETETGGMISRGRLAGVFFQEILRILVEASVCTI
jgi:hypothetical protein